MSELVRIIRDLDTARQTVLHRRSWDKVEITPETQAGIERIFGEPLSADRAVERILEDVRRDGDAALFAYNQRIDGATVTEVAQRHDVTRQQIYTWRSELKRQGLLSSSANAVFVPVDMNAVQTEVGGDRQDRSGIIELRLIAPFLPKTISPAFKTNCGNLSTISSETRGVWLFSCKKPSRISPTETTGTP